MISPRDSASVAKRRRAAATESCPKTTQILRSRLQIEAAGLAADGKMSVMEIAEKIGVSKKTIDRWARSPAFQEAKQKILDEAERRVMSNGVANKIRRIQAASRRWELMMRVIDERAADPGMASVPGGATGMLVRELKSIGAGERNQLVEEYTFDAALVKELRELERQVAQELGQFGEVTLHGQGTSASSTKVIFEWVDGETQ